MPGEGVRNEGRKKLEPNQARGVGERGAHRHTGAQRRQRNKSLLCHLQELTRGRVEPHWSSRPLISTPQRL